MPTKMQWSKLWALAGLAWPALASCDGPRTDHLANQQSSGLAEQVDQPVLPLPQVPLDREGLLLAVAKATSAQAMGVRDHMMQQHLDRQPFELKIRFGCNGPASSPGSEPLLWRFDRERRTLRLRAALTLSKETPAIGQLGAPFESVEGFWLDRPWLFQPACPISVQRDSEVAHEDEDVAKETVTRAVERNSTSMLRSGAPNRGFQDVGVAQFFSADESRTLRRNSRAYEATKLLAGDQYPSSQGYNLVLSGRLRALSSGLVISCVVGTADGPPPCVVSVELDRVRFEDPSSGETLAEWRDN